MSRTWDLFIENRLGKSHENQLSEGDHIQLFGNWERVSEIQNMLSFRMCILLFQNGKHVIGYYESEKGNIGVSSLKNKEVTGISYWKMKRAHAFLKSRDVHTREMMPRMHKTKVSI